MREIKKVVIAGAGTMGSGIAQAFAQARFKTTLVDVNADQLHRGLEKIASSLKKFEEKGKIQTGEARAVLDRISISTDLASGKDGDLFIEAVPEEFSLKARILQKADALFAPHTIFASNTSGL